MNCALIWKEFALEAAHWLPNVTPGHKCGRMHGHSFKVRVYLKGVVDEPTGWVMDFSEIKDVFAEIHELLDHRTLNDVAGLSNPTSENLARWVYEFMNRALKIVHYVEVQETCTCGARYPGDA